MADLLTAYAKLIELTPKNDDWSLEDYWVGLKPLTVDLSSIFPEPFDLSGLESVFEDATPVF